MVFFFCWSKKPCGFTIQQKKRKKKREIEVFIDKYLKFMRKYEILFGHPI